VQQLAILVRTDVRNRQNERTRANGQVTSEHARESDPPSIVPEDSPLPDAAYVNEGVHSNERVMSPASRVESHS